MASPNQSRMTATREFRQKCIIFGAKLQKLLEEKHPSAHDLERAGYSLATLKKKTKGVNVVEFIQLGELAKVFGMTPNDLLDFPIGDDRGAVKGAIEGVAQHFGMTLDEARELGEVVAKALDRRAIRNSGSSLQDSARIVVRSVIEEFFHSKSP